MSQEKRENFFTELLKFTAIVAVPVILMRLFIAQPFVVSGASMVPTFENGEYLIVDEATYHFAQPQRGDVLIFQAPKQPRGVFYIKRLIGLPGETVMISDNGVSVKKTDGTTLKLDDSYVVNHGNGNKVVEVPLGQYFVMGDNRPESSDSRSWGTLPRADIVGRVFLRLLPIQQLGIFPGKVSEPQ